MSVLDKMDTGGSGGPTGDLGCGSDGFGDDYPGIFEILATSRRKGKVRETGRLSLSVDCGKACLCLTSKEAGVCAFYRAEGFSEALEGLERQLQAGTADWRKDRWA